MIDAVPRSSFPGSGSSRRRRSANRPWPGRGWLPAASGRVAALAVATATMLAGCVAPAASIAPEGDSARPGLVNPGVGHAARSAAIPPAGAGAPPTVRPPSERRQPQYLRIQPVRTGLANAVDDGRNTYLGFGRAAPDDLAVFDQDGKPLVFARAGAVAAVSGVHQGVLIRTAGRHSYVAPNPAASSNDRPSIDDDPDVVEARSRLEGEASQAAAFQRAVERASAAVVAAAGPPGSPEPAGAPPPVRQAAASGPSQAPPGTPVLAMAAPAVIPLSPSSWPVARSFVPAPVGAGGALPPEGMTPARLRPDDFVYQRLSDGGSLIRVFFASNSRMIVRPDDGLRRLEEEARGADEVRITGFTDSIGPRDANSALAYARAEAVRFLLIQRGVPPDRIALAAVPAAQYLAENTTDQGRALNRRAEIVLMRRVAR